MVEFIPGSPVFLFRFTPEEYDNFLNDKNYSAEEFYDKYCFATTSIICSNQKHLTREDGIKILQNMKANSNQQYTVTYKEVKN